LVFTSSPSVVFGGHGHAGIDETSPYPSRYLAHYPRTKAIAEQEVMAANGPDLATVALRPHLIWGPGDNHLLPRLVERSRAGRLVRVGTGQNRVDTVYIDNAAEAHLLAADRLSRGAAIAGHAYFIANDEPVLLWDFVNQLLDCAKAPPVRRSIPAPVAYCAGAILECVYGVMGLAGEPRMTRFLARQLSTDHWFDLSAARRELGYRPTVSVAEGLARLRASFQPSGK
jgi:nucleoside-diphosphate-sugar epimerase